MIITFRTLLPKKDRTLGIKTARIELPLDLVKRRNILNIFLVTEEVNLKKLIYRINKSNNTVNHI